MLPTGGCACHSLRALACSPSCKGIHIVEYTEAALAEVAPHVVTLANAEDLPGHGDAVRAPIRLDDARSMTNDGTTNDGTTAGRTAA